MSTADWLMIKYFHGEKYHSHCNNVERLAVVLVTCDPGEQKVRLLVLFILNNVLRRYLIQTPATCFDNPEAVVTQV